MRESHENAKLGEFDDGFAQSNRSKLSVKLHGPEKSTQLLSKRTVCKRYFLSRSGKGNTTGKDTS